MAKAGKFHREAMRTNTNNSRGNGPAPRNDASGFKKGDKTTAGKKYAMGNVAGSKDLEKNLGSGGRDGGSSTHFHQEGPTKRGNTDGRYPATASQKVRGAADGMGHGRGGMAIHPSLKGANIDSDSTMRKERH